MAVPEAPTAWLAAALETDPAVRASFSAAPSTPGAASGVTVNCRRTELGMSRRDLAENAGTPETVVGSLEHGIRAPRHVETSHAPARQWALRSAQFTRRGSAEPLPPRHLLPLRSQRQNRPEEPT